MQTSEMVRIAVANIVFYWAMAFPMNLLFFGFLCQFIAEYMLVPVVPLVPDGSSLLQVVPGKFISLRTGTFVGRSFREEKNSGNFRNKLSRMENGNYLLDLSEINFRVC